MQNTPEMTTADRSYVAPSIEVLGTIAELTEASNLVHGDVPGGLANAFS
jgi:hypothetical protein